MIYSQTTIRTRSFLVRGRLKIQNRRVHLLRHLLHCKRMLYFGRLKISGTNEQNNTATCPPPFMRQTRRLCAVSTNDSFLGDICSNG